jgi:putative ABC transport system substrate-binding protein
VKRREFITLLGGAAAAWPLAAHAQQPGIPVVGNLSGGSNQPHLIAAFQQGLHATGYIENRNVLIERQRTFDYEQLRAMADDFARRRVAVIFVGPTAASVLVVKAATTSIPIVFACLEDPVAAGLVDRLDRPAGNITGASFFVSPLERKRLELLDKLLPGTERIGVLVNAALPQTKTQISELQAAAQMLRRQLSIVSASNDSEIDAAFSSLVKQRAAVLLVASDPFLFGHRDRLVAMAARFRIPTIYNVRQYVEAGGLLSYGPNVPDTYQQAGVYVGRILNGAKPSELPVVLPTRFQLVINLKTAKALGLTVPPTLLALADEVIE